MTRAVPLENPVAELSRRLDRYAATGSWRDLEEPELADITLENHPLILLGANAVMAGDLVKELVESCQVVALVENKSRHSLEKYGLPITGSDSLAELYKKYPTAIAIICAFGLGGVRFYVELCESLELPWLGMFSAARRIDGFTFRTGQIWDAYQDVKQLVRLAGDDAVSKLLADEYSRTVLACTHLYRFGWHCKWQEKVVRETDQYFPRGIVQLRDDEVLIDGGAYVGATAKRFVDLTSGNYKRIVCFEPDPENLAALKNWALGNDRIELDDRVLWSTEMDLSFDTLGTDGSSVKEGGNNVMKAVSLDSFGFTDATQIKLDIEGAEAQALAGSIKTIISSRPRLTIAAYHRPGDLSELSRQIADVLPEAKFYLRHHTKHLFDTVLYAIPE